MNVCLFLCFGEVVNKHTRHFPYSLQACGFNSAMTGYYIEVAVDNNWIDKSELTQRRAELVFLSDRP